MGKREDATFHVKDGKLTDRLERFYAFALSAKRYALFNIDERVRPIL